jgi:hypothetical protein
MGINIHPAGDRNAELFPVKLGDNGFLVPSFGMMLSYEKYVWKDILSLKFMISGYTDCAMGFAGFSHLGFRIKLLSIGKHVINTGIGPTFIFRRSWYRFDNYDDTLNFYNGSKDTDYQFRFVIYGGEIEYNYNIRKNIDFSLTFVPGIPILMTFMPGIRIRM